MILGAEDLWILLIASLVAIACALPGTFLVVRKMAMLGDAISHAVLFGIALAFLLTAARVSFIIFLGAVLVGLLTALAANYLNRTGGLQQDAAIGVVFTFLFASGVILIALFADQIDLDLDCVLFGEIAFTPFDRLELFKIDLGPRAFWVMLLITIINLVVIYSFYDRLKLVAFDPIFASSQGIKTNFWFYLLMSLVSLTCVAALEVVGVILVVGMLVIPANTALIFSKRLSRVLIFSVIFGTMAVFLGYFLALQKDASISGAIVIVAGSLLTLVIILSKIKQLGTFQAKT